MMLEIICFLLGIHLAMLLIAACYRMIDLWYRISDYLFDILLRILAIAGVIGICLWALDGDLRNAFIAGQLFFAVFHITIYWIGKAMVFYLTRR